MCIHVCRGLTIFTVVLQTTTIVEQAALLARQRRGNHCFLELTEICKYFIEITIFYVLHWFASSARSSTSVWFIKYRCMGPPHPYPQCLWCDVRCLHCINVSPWEAWWLNGSAPDCCPAVLGSNTVSPQPTADCQSPDGLPPGMALGWGLTSVRGDRGENHEKWTAGSPKT